MSLKTPEMANNTAEPLRIWNCIECRRRKVRCDRRHPCTPCIKNSVDCVFPVSGRVPRRSRDANGSQVQKQAELVGRLRRLEAMVGGLGSKIENVTKTPQGYQSVGDSDVTADSTSNDPSWADLDTIANTIANASQPDHMPADPVELRVNLNGDLVVGKGFWTIFCKEVEDIFEAVNGHEVLNFDDDGTSSVPGNTPHTGYYNFLLKNASAPLHTKNMNPLPSQLLFLWQVYMDNIDPFIKILHGPTISNVIHGIRGSYDKLGSSMHALILAVSLAAIMTLDEDEIDANFNTSKDQLIAQYRLGTEQLLQQVDYLNTSDLTALQALAIYVNFLQHTGETKPAWRLAGILVRAAVSMKFHHDGSQDPDKTAFDVEIHRRLWWQICLIDSRTDERHVSGFKIREDMFDTKMPTNYCEMIFGMPLAIGSIRGWTEITPLLIRCEVWKLSRQMQSMKMAGHAFDIDQQYKILQQSQADIQDNYLKYANLNKPLEAFVTTSARLFFAKAEFILSTKPHSSHAGESHRNRIFMSSISILEDTWSLSNEPTWRGWSWQIEGRQPPWHALHIVLQHLCARDWKLPDNKQALSALSITERTIDNRPEEARSDPRYAPIEASLAAARKKAEESQLVWDNDGFTSAAHSNYSLLTKQNRTGNLSTWVPQELFTDMADDIGTWAYESDAGMEFLNF